MLSRWKLMAGVLGVSIGGLAAAASQCPKFDRSKGRSAESPVAKAEPKLPPAGAPSTPPPPPAPALEVPAPPQLTPGGSTPPAPTPVTPELPKVGTPTPPAPVVLLPEPTGASPKLPDPAPPAPNLTLPATDKAMLPPVIPTAAAIPAKPESKPTEPVLPKVDTEKKPSLPPAPPVSDLVPTPPAAAPVEVIRPLKADSGPPSPGGITPPLPGKPTPPAPSVPPSLEPGSLPPAKPPAAPLGDGSEVPPIPERGAGAPASVTPTPYTAPAATAVQAGQTPFRILLRVGEGEPTFEVKNGDNLVLKVACEKVDIKSPEKGAGMSEVTARGKVRFAGFGAEGTCEELKFFAGTGEVSMTGTVKVQVKDKLGRVESELTTGSMKYKIDTSAVGGQIKP
jgi:hypothetical protein